MNKEKQKQKMKLKCLKEKEIKKDNGTERENT